MPTDIPAPFVSTPMRVEDQWIDYNGHFNMAYYNVLFDRAADQAFEILGLGPDYVKNTNCSFFTLEAHITYLRELHANDVVIVETHFLDCDEKRVHYVQEMYHELDEWLSCVLEVIVSHVDLVAKKTSKFPDNVYLQIESACAAHNNLPIPPQVGHRIAIPHRK